MTEINTIQQLEEANQQATDAPFGPYQEEAIVSLALDHPDLFTTVGHFLKPSLFKRPEVQFVIEHILQSLTEFNVVPTRALLRERLERVLTIDMPYESVLGLVERKSDYREVPLIKDTLLKWARNRAFGLLYSPEAIAAYKSGNFEYLEHVFEDANRIADFGDHGFWFLSNYQMLFEPAIIEHRTTGFPRLDRLLNDGGPSPKEVLCWLAATNVGKSILLCNNAISSLRGLGSNNEHGQDVLLVTFELDTIKTAMRCLGALTGVPLNQLVEKKEFVTRMMEQFKRTYNKRLFIHEMPPDECSVNHIYALVDVLKKRDGWKPDVIVLDYLDLMISRNKAYNKDDYTRQKHVATEVRGLAKNENVLVFTATQTNRSGAESDERAGAKMVDLTKAAESFGKQFPLDYVISLNQNMSEREAMPPRLRLYVAKNRNGPKHDTITCEINYNTMLVKELL